MWEFILWTGPWKSAECFADLVVKGRLKFRASPSSAASTSGNQAYIYQQETGSCDSESHVATRVNFVLQEQILRGVKNILVCHSCWMSHQCQHFYRISMWTYSTAFGLNMKHPVEKTDIDLFLQQFTLLPELTVAPWSFKSFSGKQAQSWVIIPLDHRERQQLIHYLCASAPRGWDGYLSVCWWFNGQTFKVKVNKEDRERDKGSAI